jgi:hypothetical protein
MRRGRTDKAGKLTLYPVLPGKWRAAIMLPGTAEGGAASAAKEVTVAAEGGSVTIPITLPAPAAK